MGKEILNRRQNILADAIPPEIPTGAVTATSYATSSTGGVIKVDGDYGLDITSGGKLKGKAISAANYAAANNAALLCKETYENIKPGIASADALGMIKVGSGLSIADGVLSAAAAGGLTITQCWQGSPTGGNAVALTTPLEGFSLVLILGEAGSDASLACASAIVPVSATDRSIYLYGKLIGDSCEAIVKFSDSNTKVETNSVSHFTRFTIFGIK